MQLHLGTASKEGTVEGLTRVYRQIASKLAGNLPLTPAEENYVGYDAIQLLPIEPTIEYRDEYSPESEFFVCIAEDEDDLQIKLKKPNTQDWGYDVPILGSSATNAAVLSSLRPDELVDFIATLHNFPTGPIQIIYDLVYGHADNQSELLLHRQFLKGPNMYGQDLNHQLPTVRAMFLEMQRRKINTGADGVRIDGGQDFRFFNPLSGLVEYDDAYLLAMSDVVQDIDGHQRLLFTIFEDGRPWPAEGWEEISTYRELINLKPESFQWGPLIFAHNTPALEKFWDRKWRRVCEVIFEGDHWITGCGNH
ncbi:MAG: glucosylglycerol hydrolase, partial [Coleofasciculus sp. C2-GNP5-27]